MNPKQTGRRRFLKGSAAVVGGLVAGAIQPASGEEVVKPEIIRANGLRPQGELSRYEKLSRTGTATQGFAPLQDLQGIITPTQVHFYVNHERGVLMNIDPAQHRVMIYGMVDHPLVLTMAELKRLPSVSRIHFLECNANTNPTRADKATSIMETHGLTSCAEWTGVKLSLLLKEAGVQKGANWLLIGSADPSHHASSVPMEKGMDDVLVVYSINGQPLPLEHGYPVRVICPGWGGRFHVKWLDRIKVVNEPYMTIQDRTSFMEHTPAGEGAFLVSSPLARRYQYESYAKSVITFPSPGHHLPERGFYEITGLAWSGSGPVRRVEVSTDGGKTWKDAELQEPILSKAHTRFRFPWKWNGEEAVLQSRCTDAQGDVQPSATEISKNWGSDKSEACVSVMGKDCEKIPRRAHRAYIFSWRVATDGNISNAFKTTPEMLKVEEGDLEMEGHDH